MCALLEIGLSFMSPRILKRIFPPIVTGPTVLLIGVKLISSGFKNWAGGSGPCSSRPATGLFSMCPTINAPHPLPWGSPEFIGKHLTAIPTSLINVFILLFFCRPWFLGLPDDHSLREVWESNDEVVQCCDWSIDRFYHCCSNRIF